MNWILIYAVTFFVGAICGYLIKELLTKEQNKSKRIYKHKHFNK